MGLRSRDAAPAGIAGQSWDLSVQASRVSAPTTPGRGTPPGSLSLPTSPAAPAQGHCAAPERFPAVSLTQLCPAAPAMLSEQEASVHLFAAQRRVFHAPHNNVFALFLDR